MLTGNPPLGLELGLKAKRTHTLYNGPIECRLLRFDVDAQHFATKRVPGRAAGVRHGSGARAARRRDVRESAAQERDGARRLGAAAKASRATASTTPTCRSTRSRSISIRRAWRRKPRTRERWVYVQEYAPPATVDPAKARARREEAFAVLPEVLGVPRERVHLRTRRKQKGGAQYEKLAERGEFHRVARAACSCFVNFTDYLDTGLFLDHRPTRARIRELAPASGS